LRLANELGYGAANQILAPVAAYEGMSDEQRSMIKKMQKEAAEAKKESTRSRPYQPAANRSDAKTISQCRVCGVTGHWAADGKCKPADIQAKAMRDAAA